MSQPVITLSASDGLRIIHVARPDLAAPAFRLRETTSYRFMGRSGWTRVSMFLPCQISVTEDGWWIIPDASVLPLLEDGMELCLEEPAQGFREVFRWSFPAEEPEEQEEPPAAPAEAVADISVIEEESASSAATLPKPEPEIPGQRPDPDETDSWNHSAGTELTPVRSEPVFWRYAVAALGGAAIASMVVLALEYRFPELVTAAVREAPSSSVVRVPSAQVTEDTEGLRVELSDYRKRITEMATQLSACHNNATDAQEVPSCVEQVKTYETKLGRLVDVNMAKIDEIKKLNEQITTLSWKSRTQRIAADQEIFDLKDQIRRLEESKAVAPISSDEKAIWGGAVLARSGVIYTLQNQINPEGLRKNLLSICKGNGGTGCEVISIYSNKCLSLARAGNEGPALNNWGIGQEPSWEASQEISLRACVSVTGRSCTVRFTTCSPASLEAL